MTLFVIIAIVIVVAALLIYQFVPGLKSTGISTEENPKAYMQVCIEEELQSNIEKISLQGGSLVPDHPYMYQGVNIDYLCYTSKYNELCQVEQPLLVTHVENEIKDSIKVKVNECFDKMIEDYESKGYSVNLKKGDVSVELSPNKIEVLLDTQATISKKQTQTYENFKYILNDDLYNRVMLAYSLVNFESQLGDMNINLYMDLSNVYKIEKIKRTDGTKIYIITERSSDKVFQFASRSLVTPAGLIEVQSQ